MSRLAAARAGAIAEWSSQRRWATDGSRSASSRLEHDAHIGSRSARIEVRRARQLRTMSLTAAALAAGTISTDHVDLLASCNTGRHR